MFFLQQRFCLRAVGVSTRVYLQACMRVQRFETGFYGAALRAFVSGTAIAACGFPRVSQACLQAFKKYISDVSSGACGEEWVSLVCCRLVCRPRLAINSRPLSRRFAGLQQGFVYSQQAFQQVYVCRPVSWRRFGGRFYWYCCRRVVFHCTANFSTGVCLQAACMYVQTFLQVGFLVNRRLVCASVFFYSRRFSR